MGNEGRHFKQPNEAPSSPRAGYSAPPRHAAAPQQRPYAQGRQPVSRQQVTPPVSQPTTSAHAVRPLPVQQTSTGAQGVRPVQQPVDRGRMAGQPSGAVHPIRPASPSRAASRGASATGSPYARSARPAGHDSSKRPRSGRNIASYVLIAVGVILLLVSGGLFLRAQMGYKQASDFYSNLNKDVLKVEDTSGDGIPSIDFDALKKVNDDVVGWIYVPGTNINYVVAQGDTNDTYLRHLISGEYNANGTVFVDMDDTAPGLVDQQTTLYGHHMNDGSMFSVINETVDQRAFDAIKKVYYITPDATYELKPMFTMRVEDDYVDARKANFDNEDAFKQYLKASFGKAQARAKDASEQIDQAAHVMTLVTCDDAFLAQTKRTAMVCTLVGEVGGSDQPAEPTDQPAQ